MTWFLPSILFMLSRFIHSFHTCDTYVSSIDSTSFLIILLVLSCPNKCSFSAHSMCIITLSPHHQFCLRNQYMCIVILTPCVHKMYCNVPTNNIVTSSLTHIHTDTHNTFHTQTHTIHLHTSTADDVNCCFWYM